MYRFITTLLLAVTAMTMSFCKEATPVHTLKVTGLTCEYLTDPLSIENRHPRLAWKITDERQERNNQTQTAYQIYGIVEK